ncbi:universal stress protein [Silicimonas algicola]|uniref:Universal stress protein family protein n=1 Tax=Silicimonas algicola TaxID=1826607 RepID=A0A316FZR5_9RHOB|nr:universal stress protein [Silicimonas algicola]AZQ69050.1 universal stress protein [Silicimonas algicola]PWK54059.1 universal stress protein family protein [Silicimonas algicola]
MKHIVVATDMSERSDRALARALSLARETGARCTVTSVVEDALPEDLANQLCESTHARQFLAIGAHARSTPSFHKLGRYTADLIRNPPVDLLVAR